VAVRVLPGRSWEIAVEAYQAAWLATL